MEENENPRGGILDHPHPFSEVSEPAAQSKGTADLGERILHVSERLWLAVELTGLFGAQMWARSPSAGHSVGGAGPSFVFVSPEPSAQGC